MANVFIGIAQELVVDRLISNVRARRTRSGSATYIDQRHHGIIADLLESKWLIGLDKEKSTLQSTTQYNLILALKPLTWW